MAVIEDEFERLAARHLRKQAEALRRDLPGVRVRGDVEPVHRARVAARRLRAGLDLFAECFPPKKVKRWKKAARRFLKALGPARDRDVQAAFVRDFAADLRKKSHRPGVARLVLRLEQERDALQGEVVKAADRFEAAGVVREVLAARPHRPRRRGTCDDACLCDAVLRRSGPEVRRRLRKMLALQEGLSDPDDLRRHHAMRIATKRLRYALEACKPACGRRVGRYVSAARKVQTLLGDVHDCDVWAEQLKAFLEGEEARTIRYFGYARGTARLGRAIEHLREDRLACRRRLFKKLGTVWRRLRQQGLWEDLERMVEAAAVPPAVSSAGPPAARGPAISGAEEGRHAPAAA